MIKTTLDVELIMAVHCAEKFDDEKCDYRTEVPQLRLGKRYSATLVDLEEEDTIASFVFTASMMILMVMLLIMILLIFSLTSSP